MHVAVISSMTREARMQRGEGKTPRPRKLRQAKLEKILDRVKDAIDVGLCLIPHELQREDAGKDLAEYIDLHYRVRP